MARTGRSLLSHPTGGNLSAGFRFARKLFKDDFTGLAVGDLGCVHDAGSVVGADHNPVQKNKHRQREVQVEERLGSGKLEDATLLIKAVEAGCAQFDQARFQGLGQGRFGGRSGRSLGGGFARGFRRPASRFGLRGRRGLGVAHREKRVETRSLAQPERGLGDLVHRVALDQPVAVDAVDRSAAGVEQAQIIVDFGRRGHGRARIARRILLLDGDGRRQPVDQVHVRLLDTLQKLPRIGRERLHVAPLPLGVDGVEGKRALARSGDTADDRQLAVRNLAGDVLQVVCPRAADDDGVIQREAPGVKSRPLRLCLLRESPGTNSHSLL